MAFWFKSTEKLDLYIICVYLPSSNSPANEFRKTVEELEDVINQLYNRGTIMVLGEFNCHIGTFELSLNYLFHILNPK